MTGLIAFGQGIQPAWVTDSEGQDLITVNSGSEILSSNALALLKMSRSVA